MIKDANQILRGKFMQEPGFRYVQSPKSPDMGLARGFDGAFTVTQSRVANGGLLSEPVRMTSAAKTACFLTHISGAFGTGAEAIWIQRNGEKWELSADTHYPDQVATITGRARCIERAVDGGELIVDELERELATGEVDRTFDLGTSDGRSCFLMGVRGALTHSDMGAYAYQEGGRWKAWLNSTWQAPDHLRAKFGCINGRFISQDHASENVTQDQLSSRGTASVAGAPPVPVDDGIFCALSGVRGQFAQNGEIVEILPHSVGEQPITFPVTWQLRTAEGRFGHTVRGNSSCFWRPGFE